MLSMKLWLSDLMAFYLSGSLLSEALQSLSLKEGIRDSVHSSLELKAGNVEKVERQLVPPLTSLSTASLRMRIFLVSSCLQVLNENTPCRCILEKLEKAFYIVPQPMPFIYKLIQFPSRMQEFMQVGCLCKTKENIILIIIHRNTLFVLKYESFLKSLKGKTTHVYMHTLSYMYRRKIKPLQAGTFFFSRKFFL